MSKLVMSIISVFALSALLATPSLGARYRVFLENNNDPLVGRGFNNQYQCEEESEYGNSCVQIHGNCGYEPLWAEDVYVSDWSYALGSSSTYMVVERFEDEDGDGVYDYGERVCTIGADR